MPNEVQKNSRIEKRVHFILFLCVLAGVSLLIVGLREITKDIPVPEDKFAPKLTSAPQLNIQGMSELQNAEKNEPYSFYVNGKKIDGTIIPIEDSGATPLPNEKRSSSGNKPSQESHFKDSVSTVESNG